MRHAGAVGGREMADAAGLEKAALLIAEPVIAGHGAILRDRVRDCLPRSRTVGSRPRAGTPADLTQSGDIMSEAASVALSPETVLAQMKQNGVTDIVWLPDSETNWLYLLMKAEPSLRLVGVNREGHACSIAAGLAAGGRKPLILIQNTGMMESGDSIRGWLLGPQRAGRDDGRLSRLDPARHDDRHRRDLYRALSDGVQHLITTSSRATPTRRASPPPSRMRRAPSGRLSCWSATSITASIGSEGCLR